MEIPFSPLFFERTFRIDILFSGLLSLLNRVYMWFFFYGFPLLFAVFSHRSVVLRFFYIASIGKRTLLWFCIFCFACYPAIWTACYGKLGALCRRYCCFSNIWIGNVWIVAVCHYSCSWLSSALLWMFGSRKELKNKKVGMGRRSRGPHERITWVITNGPQTKEKQAKFTVCGFQPGLAVFVGRRSARVQ